MALNRGKLDRAGSRALIQCFAGAAFQQRGRKEVLLHTPLLIVEESVHGARLRLWLQRCARQAALVATVLLHRKTPVHQILNDLLLAAVQLEKMLVSLSFLQPEVRHVLLPTVNGRKGPAQIRIKLLTALFSLGEFRLPLFLFRGTPAAVKYLDAVASRALALRRLSWGAVLHAPSSGRFLQAHAHTKSN